MENNLTLPPALPVENWYYFTAGNQQGPVDAATLTGWVEGGILDRSTLVWKAGMADWAALSATSLGARFTTPPPVTGTAVNNTAVWVWAFSALLPMEQIWQGLGVRNPSLHMIWSSWWMPSGLLFWWDASLLKASGNRPRKWEGWQLWGLFIVPVYLFVRAAKLRQNCAYAVVWVVCAVISLFY